MNTEAKNAIQLQRTYNASIEDVWELWTTKDGIESWWGPDGFSVEVIELDVQPGGHLYYAMSATAEPQIAFMKRAGMPLTTKTRITYTEVAKHQRLAFSNLADFIPGVAPYQTAISVDFALDASVVHVALTLGPMHDEVWTGRMTAGWKNQLEKLDGVISARR